MHDAPQTQFAWLQAEPTYLEINGNTACVVGDIKELTDWYDTPIITVFKVVDTCGGPDKIWVFNLYSPYDPAVACTLIGEPHWRITAGNFTILP